MTFDRSIGSKTKLAARYSVEVSQPVLYIGWALIGSGLNTILFSLLIYKDQVDLVLALASSILTAATPFLLGCVLICCSLVMNPSDSRHRNHANLVRACCRWYAFVLIAFVPIQFIVGAQAVSKVSSENLRSLEQRKWVIQNLKAAENEKQFRNFISNLPDRPQIPEKFEDSYVAIRTRVVKSLMRQYRLIEISIQRNNELREKRFFVEIFKNSVQSFLIAAGLWSLRSARWSHMRMDGDY